MKLSRPVWAEINLDNLAHNIREVRRVTNENAKVTAVIKADGYGHGAVAIGKTLLENGADRFAVATLSEAIQLRAFYPDTDIMILGYTPEDSAEEVINNNIIQTLYSVKQARVFSEMATKLNKKLRIHIKLDTGMSRLGMQATEEVVDEIQQISKMNGLDLEGVFTHFAVADEVDKTFTMQQVKKYDDVIESLEELGVMVPIKHVSNSASIIDLPELNFDMVRAGIMLYGLYPSKDVNCEAVELKEVMCLKARISHVKDLEAGRGVSYGLKYKTKEKTRIATLPLGYADGYTRMLSGKANVIVNGVKVPVVGRICMDQCMIDVTGMDIKAGDEVTIYGGNNPLGISIDSVADALDTINYEIVCMLNKRVPRVYLENGKFIDARDYVLMLSK